MSDSPRELFMQKAELALRSMTGVRFWGGAYPNDPTVVREMTMPIQVGKHPHVCLLPDSGSRISNREEDGATQDKYIDLFRGVLIGYVNKTTDVPASVWLERFNRDCKVTLIGSVFTAALINLDDFDDEEVAFYQDASASFLLPFTAHLEDALGQ
jgi:hypothetical protein